MKVSVNRRIFYLSMSIIVLVMTLTGTTMAISNYNKEIILDNDSEFRSSYLEVSSEDNQSSIVIDSVPMEDYIGIESGNSKTFTIKNTGNLPYVFSVQFLPNNSEGINSKYIKVQVDNNSPYSLNYYNNIVDEDNKITYVKDMLNNYLLLPGDSMSMEVRVWLDIETPNSEIGKNIGLNLVTVGYAENLYQNDDIGKLAGNGTKEDPYLINSPGDLVYFSDSVNNGNDYKDKYIKLNTSIDFKNAISYSSNNCLVNNEYKFNDKCLEIVEFNSIGNKDNIFRGNFDGDNHHIKNIPYKNGYSLFGYIENADIKNIIIDGDYSVDNTDTIGSVVGISNNSTINNCYSRVNYSISDLDKVYVGGIVGISNNSTINNNYNYGYINVDNVNETYAGGIVGSNNDKSIDNNYNYGYIYGVSKDNNYIGGIIGYGYGDSNYNYGIVSGNSTNNYLGGIVGYSNKKINNNYNYGMILDGYYKEHKYINDSSTNNYLGGIVGISNNDIDNSNNYGIVRVNSNNNNYLGGISGYLVGNISNSTNNSNIISNSDSKDNYVGGISGYLDDNSKIDSSYNDSVISSKCGYLGGISGYNSNNSIVKNTYNKGNINILGNKKDIYVGGISGYIKSLGLVNSVYNSGNIKGNNINTGNIGGIVGSVLDNSSINYSYNIGKININDIDTGNMGGIVGEVSNSNIMYDYSIGKIDSNSNINIGSGIGLLDTSKVIVYSLSSNANNIIGSGISNDSNIFTKSYMKSKEFLNLLNTEENKWDIDSNINNGFPYLKELKRQ